MSLISLVSQLITAPFITAFNLLLFFLITPLLLFIDVVVFGTYLFPVGVVKFIVSFRPKYFDFSTLFELCKLIYYFASVAILLGTVIGLIDAIMMYGVHRMLQFTRFSFRLPLFDTLVTIFGTPKGEIMDIEESEGYREMRESIKENFDMGADEIRRILSRKEEEVRGATRGDDSVDETMMGVNFSGVTTEPESDECDSVSSNQHPSLSQPSAELAHPSVETAHPSVEPTHSSSTPAETTVTSISESVTSSPFIATKEVK